MTIKIFSCEFCGKEKKLFDLAKWNRSKKHYCSPVCAGAAKKGKKLSHEHRTKVIKTLVHGWNKGKPAWNKGMVFPENSGKNCHLWKGGVTKLSAQIRTSEEYRMWRRSCLERDNYTCTDCGQRGGNKNVDHVVAFAVLIKKFKIVSFAQAKKCKNLWNVKNGRTLCVPCHAKTDTFPSNLRKYQLLKTLVENSNNKLTTW